jgi:hypothetical protein
VQRERDNGEHHDVPGTRREHDPAIVDAHLQALAAEAQALARASAALHDRVRAVEGELNALTLSLRAGAEEPVAPWTEERPEAAPETMPPASRPEAVPPASVSVAEEEHEAPLTAPAATHAAPTPPAAAVAAPTPPVAAEAGEQRRSDLDSARLVALNMALSGESREQADRRLADSFELADRAKLLDEVYAAVEH